MSSGEWARRVREGLEAFNRGDVEGVLRDFHPDVEMKRIDGSPDGHDLIRGRDAVAAFLEPDAFERQTIEPIEIVEGDDVVVVHNHVHARGAGSGLEFSIESYTVYRIEAGLVRRIESWRSREDAARASGLDL